MPLLEVSRIHLRNYRPWTDKVGSQIQGRSFENDSRPACTMLEPTDNVPRGITGMNRRVSMSLPHLAIAGVAVLTLAGAELPTLAQEGQAPAAAAGARGRGLGTAAKVKDPT